MSVGKIRKALETAVDGMTPALPTAWENWPYTPTASVAYQRVNLMFAEPGNQEYGGNYQERGIMQITLYYPEMTGAADAAARAELLRTTFRRGNSFVNSGVIVTIERTPTIGVSWNDGEHYAIPVKIRFYSNLY